jgi:hypothetical protein
MARCAHCDTEFTRRRSDHRFCSAWCRHKGERKPYDPPPVAQAAVDRLFDPRRDVSEPARADDWWPTRYTETIKALYMVEPSKCGRFRAPTVESHRRWFRNLELGDR